MLSYVVSAVGLTIALLMLSMAMGHKSILSADVQQDLQGRLNRLSADSAARWGQFTPARMLRHLGSSLKMATGELPIAPRRSPLRLFPLKQLIVFVFPFPKGAPTAPALLTRDEPHFETERAAVRELLAGFASKQVPTWPDHPAFGALTREQWGVLAWKHVDHHFRQFGV